MSQEILTRGACAGIFSLVLVFVMWFRGEDEGSAEGMENWGRRYAPYISGYLLPICLLTLAVVGTIADGAAEAARLTLSMCFGIFLEISLYYMLLLPLLPLLRRYISARACAMLWMIPNYLYLTIYESMELPEPALVLVAPGRLVWALFIVWLTGVLAVLTWKTVQHLIFRRRVLADAVPVARPEVLAVWERVLRDAGIGKPKFRLVVSPGVKTPLSIGLFSRTTRVILPRCSYREEELELILRHEIIHIAREDAWSKFFLVFCTAMCWFNPLMWAAMDRSAEDLELSCDETVLLRADGDTRRRYARLLLDTAGDERGFTTCLSASARSMRYRLRTITKPVKRSSGALVVGLTFFLLCMASGHVALAYGGTTGAERIWAGGDCGGYSLKSVHVQADGYGTTYEIRDEAGFFRYLSELTVYELTGNYSFSGGRRVNYRLVGPEDIRMVSLYDNAVKVTAYRNVKDYDTRWYYIPEGMDWEELDRFITARPAMNVQLFREGETYERELRATLTQLWTEEEGRKTVRYETQEESISGVFSSEPFRKAVLTFSQEPAAPCSVLIQSWNRSQSHILTQTERSQPFAFSLPDYAAHYTVYAGFYDQSGTLCQTQFRFDVGGV